MPIDSNRLEELQIVRRIRETVRRWWGIELSFTDARGPCHMGLEIVASPISFDGTRQGALFACGFLVEEKAGGARDRALTTLKVLSLPVEQPEDAFESVQRIEAREVPRLADLMDTTVEEIDAYHDAVALREKRIRDLQDELGGRYRFADIIGDRLSPVRALKILSRRWRARMD